MKSSFTERLAVFLAGWMFFSPFFRFHSSFVIGIFHLYIRNP
jgi:hypothetical protein